MDLFIKQKQTYRYSKQTYDYQRGNMGAAAAKSLQSCPTLCDPINGSPPGSAIPWILQARTLEWVAISFSSAWKWKVKVKSLSSVWLFTTPWTAAHQVPPSMGFSRQEYWSGVPLPSPNMGGGRTNQKLGVNITTMYQRDNKQDLLCSTENSTQYFVITYIRKEYKKCICVIELLHCTPETNTTL